MRLSRLLLAFFVFGLAALFPVHAQQLASSPYEVTLPVTDTGEAQRDETFSAALLQVLARVAGGQDLRSKAGFSDAIKGAGGMVKQYHYQRTASGIELQVSFDRAAVNHLISHLGVPAAGVKPPVLLLVQGADGRLLGKADLTALASSAAAQGYRVAYPAPGSAPDLARVARVDPAAMADLTTRYRTGLVLVGHLHPGSADWTLVSGGKAQSWGATGAGPADLLAGVGSAVASRIGSQLNVIGAGVNEGQVWVQGIHSAMDYAALLNALRGDPAVRQVSTLAAQGDAVLLRVKSVLPLSVLAANLAAGGRMLQAAPRAGADASLRWLH